jgi:hypothetical protein
MSKAQLEGASRISATLLSLLHRRARHLMESTEALATELSYNTNRITQWKKLL